MYAEVGAQLGLSIQCSAVSGALTSSKVLLILIQKA